MSIFERWFIRRRRPRYGVEIDIRLAARLEEIAAAEQRSVQDVAADLLAGAVRGRVGEAEKWAVWETLSSREQEVAALACARLANKEIGLRLSISLPTVKSHMRSVFSKTGVSSRAKLQEFFGWDFREWL